MRFLPLATLSVLLLAALRAQDAQPAGVSTPLADAIPALRDHSSWAQDARYEGESPDKSRRGVYPVGNGRVFGYLGLGARANTLQALSGPSYQTAEAVAPKGHFGEHTFTLRSGGKPLPLAEQRVRRVRGANFVVTVDEDPAGLSLRTLTFAPPDGTTIVRVIEVANLGSAAATGVTLALQVEGEHAPTLDQRRMLRRRYDLGDSQSGRHGYADFYLSEGEAAPGGLALGIDDLAPGGSWRAVLRIDTRSGPPPAVVRGLLTPGPREDDVASAREAAEATLRWWQDRLKPTAPFDTDHAKLRDLVNDWKVMMLVLRDAGSGVVAPMVNRRGFWVRDCTGPLLAFLRFNLWDEARAILKYQFDSARLLGRVAEHAPLDLDFAPLAGKTTDWDAVEVPASEVPSWVVLHHFWYWRATRDTALIKEHHPLLLRCLRGQKRVDDILLPFHGGESWGRGALASLYPERAGEGCGFLADDPERGRSAFSFAAGVQMLLATQSMTDLENGIDVLEHPERYTGEDPKDKPGQRWLTRSFALMQALEKNYWVADLNIFAPALSPVNRAPHRAPFANANLMPLWLGWTFPTGEKSRDNLRNTLQRLWRDGARIGSTPAVGHTCGHTQGQLVVALAERDARERLDAFDALLAMAEPAGEWGELHGPDGRPTHGADPQWPERLQPLDSGINLDALLFAISGVRFVVVPNWDMRDIRAELRLPRGAKYVTMRHLRKDARELDLYWRETFEKMTEEERKANAEKEADKQRDPEAVHRRLRFRMELLSENPKAGYYDVGLNAAGTLFVRWLRKDTPIDEVEYWGEDANEFLPPQVPIDHSASARVPPEAKTLYLASRGFAGELVGGEPSVALLDTGLPMTPADLAGALLDGDGRRRVDTVFFDWGADDRGRATYKPEAFWNDPRWRNALGAFAAAGGQVVRAGFVRELTAGGGQVRAAADGRFELPVAGTVTVVAVVHADAECEAVLRAGSSGPLQIDLGGERLLEHGSARPALPDQDSALLGLRAGENRLQITLQGEGTAALYLRVTDSRGLPVAGVR